MINIKTIVTNITTLKLTKIKVIICGLIIMFIGIWGGAFLCSLFDYTSSFDFAALLTGTMVYLIGVVIVIYGIFKKFDE